MRYHTFEQDKQYLLNKFQDPKFDMNTGIDNEAIKEYILSLAKEPKSTSHKIIKAKAFEYITRNVRIDVNPHDWFVGFACWNRNDRLIAPLLGNWKSEIFNTHLKTLKLNQNLCSSGAITMWPDFDHSVPDWDAVLSLGFTGLRDRAKEFRKIKKEKDPLTDDECAYYDGIDITYSAMIEMLKRFYTYAIEQANNHPRVLTVAKCLKNLIQGPPQNTYEVLQLLYLYFILGEHIDHMQVRSLGNLDRILYPYFRKDIENNVFTEKQIREFFDYFLMQFASINNYWGHPFYLGGTKENGESEINELSYLILDEFDKLNITSPKIQLKINSNTPQSFIDKALDMVRRNNSSLVFVSEQAIKRAMMGIGFSEEEARTCDISGCYEYDVRAKEVKTAPIYLNVLKPVELVLNNGIDPLTNIDCGCQTGDLESIKTFDDFYKAYIKQLTCILESAFQCADDFEQYLHEINPAHVFSATIENSLKVAKDAFSHGSIYNNTIVLHTGLATAADALAAIKHFVFKKQMLTLSEFKGILADNWQGHEKVRLKILHAKKAFGNGLKDVDSIAEAIARYTSSIINLRPNARGGFYKAAMHSARTFIHFGEKTGATPDGRKKGDEMSKNISPTMGKDINGVTALLNSVSNIDSAMFPSNYNLDIMLHPTTTQGDEGLSAMHNLIKTYITYHGASIQFNIFDVETLRKAQQNPEQYQNIQVRVCGWNVRFVDICKKEQEVYIERAQNIIE